MTAPQDDARTTGSMPVLPSSPEEPADLPAVAPAGTPSFSPRWGRIGVALVGLVALLTALVTLVPAAFGVVSLLLPVVSLAVAAAAVAVLRMLAVRARHARVEQAFLHAMAPVHEAEPAGLPVALPAAAPAAPRRPTSLFDAEETATRRLTPMELRTAALAVAHGSTAVDIRDASAQGAGAAAASGTGNAVERPAPEWAPVDLPRPTYVDAAKAERQAPAPLDLPEAPKPTSRTPIKASEAAARIAATDDTAHVAADVTPATGRINLDDVLQRRRA
ncbi:hypothetical protein V6S67_12700 [Arthrobacter sp. Soc17.1.1.1]|uniref:hypothetical protein n=1 Tax=Arthrobacter sp. Soc17.1.1.1 TaxID=3121277 RepID=UPI002FE4F0E2